MVAGTVVHACTVSSVLYAHVRQSHAYVFWYAGLSCFKRASWS